MYKLMYEKANIITHYTTSHNGLCFLVMFNLHKYINLSNKDHGEGD